ncbi:hypothetical protein ABHF33_06450 [Chitinibacter sp. FCG-7]|uniref:Uncharacterized protein n=1 Tax=Chitinibacter mangrovi TaxID=3153927 RepID=A0AAU7FE22_9NEIS
MLLILSSFALASEKSSDEPQDVSSYPVVVNNRTLIEFRSGILHYSAQDRAQAAELRVKRILARHPGGTVRQNAINTPAVGASITLNGEQLFMILASDINTLSGETLEATAQQSVHQVSMLVAESRELRNPRQLLQAAALALLASAIFAALLYLLSRTRVVLMKNGRRYFTRYDQPSGAKNHWGKNIPAQSGTALAD